MGNQAKGEMMDNYDDFYSEPSWLSRQWDRLKWAFRDWRWKHTASGRREFASLQQVTAEFLRVLQANTVMPNLIKRDYNKHFEAAPRIGATITVRKPERFAEIS